MAIYSNLESNLENTENINSTEFTVQADPALFSMLTKNVYTDIISAPIREFSTNAIDACLEACEPVLFDVHLPTTTESHFSVRDYGTGLSKEHILDLFTVVGASTKRDSNLYNGQFGIGRLSALAYSDSFTVESFYEGNYYSYLITLQKGIPQAIELASEYTTEPNGLRLSLEVKPEDISKFRDKAQVMYRHFEYKPNLNIDLDLTVDYLTQGTDWFMLNEYNSRNFILMSNVLYKIDSYDINTQDLSGIILKVPTGAVSINPGRESLSIDKETIKYLSDRFQQVSDEYVQNVVTSTIAGATIIDRTSTFDSLYSAAPYGIRKKLTYPASQDPEFSKFCSSSYGSIQFSPKALSIDFSYKHRGYSNFKRDTRISMSSAKNYTFFIADMKTGYKKAASKYLSLQERQPGIILLSHNIGTFEQFIIDAKQLVTDLGASYALASDYKVANTPKEKIEGMKVHPLHYGSIGASTKAQTDETYWYIPSKGTEALVDNLSTLTKAYSLIPQDLRKPFVAVSKTFITTAEESDQFIRAEDEIKSAIESVEFKHPTSDLLDFQHNRLRQYQHLIPDLKTIFDTLSTYKSTEKPGIFAQNLQSLSDYTLKTEEFTTQRTLDSFFKQYPLLYDGVDKDHAKHYIELEDYYAAHKTKELDDTTDP